MCARNTIAKGQPLKVSEPTRPGCLRCLMSTSAVKLRNPLDETSASSSQVARNPTGSSKQDFLATTIAKVTKKSSPASSCPASESAKDGTYRDTKKLPSDPH